MPIKRDIRYWYTEKNTQMKIFEKSNVILKTNQLNLSTGQYNMFKKSFRRRFNDHEKSITEIIEKWYDSPDFLLSLDFIKV